MPKRVITNKYKQSLFTCREIRQMDKERTRTERVREIAAERE